VFFVELENVRRLHFLSHEEERHVGQRLCWRRDLTMSRKWFTSALHFSASRQR